MLLSLMGADPDVNHPEQLEKSSLEESCPLPRANGTFQILVQSK